MESLLSCGTSPLSAVIYRYMCTCFSMVAASGGETGLGRPDNLNQKEWQSTVFHSRRLEMSRVLFVL